MNNNGNTKTIMARLMDTVALLCLLLLLSNSCSEATTRDDNFFNAVPSAPERDPSLRGGKKAALKINRASVEKHKGKDKEKEKEPSPAEPQFDELTDSTCPSMLDTLRVDDISDDFRSWLSFPGSGGFMDALVELMKTEINAERGSTILDKDSDSYPEVCHRFPLNDDDCYLVNDPAGNWMRDLVADAVPFGKEINDAVKTVEELLAELQQQAKDVEEFFLAGDEPEASCVVASENVVGVVSNPGFPPPWIYQFCNCASLLTNGVEACLTQVYFRGFAVSKPGSNALVYDLGNRLSGDSRLYDGFAEYAFRT